MPLTKLSLHCHQLLDVSLDAHFFSRFHQERCHPKKAVARFEGEFSELENRKQG